MPLAQCIARPALHSWKSTSIHHGFWPPKNLWSRNVAIPHAQEEDLFETADGVPQGDPVSTLVFATAMSLLLDVSMVALYVDDTVLLDVAANVTQAITEIQAETATGGLKLQKAKTQVWSPTQQSIDNELLLHPARQDGRLKGHSDPWRNCF